MTRLGGRSSRKGDKVQVFISYAHDDAHYASQLSKALRERGIEVLGANSIVAGANWVTSIQNMLENADAFVLLTSKSSSASRWVDREIAFAAVRASRDQNVRLIPVLLDRHAEISPLLSRYQYIGPPDADDPEHVADIVEKSLGTPVPPPDLNLEREFVETEQEHLETLIAQRESAVARASKALARALSIVGLAVGVVATILVAVWADSGVDALRVATTALSLLSTSLAAVIALSWGARK